MKHLLVFILFFSTANELPAQYPKLIIQFTNKEQNAYALSNPSSYLSERSLQRRTRQNIEMDSTDLPISEAYIDSLRLSGNVQILSRSKWLNQVLIQSTDAVALARIQQFSFVKKVDGVGYRSPVTRQGTRERLVEEQSPIGRRTNSAQRALNDVFDYGNAYAQVHLHEGEFLHNRGFKGESMQIAVFDAGFRQYKSNAAFDSLRLMGGVLGERDFVAFDNSVNEDDLHGANCLSILAANLPGRMVGTAPNASYWLLRSENEASEYPIEEHNWVVAAEFADSSGADMISSSLGYYDFDDRVFNHSYSEYYRNATMVSTGATWAAKKGIIVMNSVGNEGNNTWKYQAFPADADSICAVGAVNANRQIAAFSSFGYPGKVKPNIVSLGAGITIATPNNQLIAGNGTSYSNPNVAGLIACLWQAFPTFKNMEILDAVYRSSDRYNAPDPRYGFGIPNFKTAYRLLKKQLNLSTFAGEWFIATPNTFTSKIDIAFIGQLDGNVKIELVNAAGQVLFVQNFITEQEEVYTFSFNNLEPLPAGNYHLKYSDNNTTRNINVEKVVSNGGTEWLRIVQGTIINGKITVLFTAIETSPIAIRLIDSKGSLKMERQLTTTLGQAQAVEFDTERFAKGVYYLQYVSKSQQKVVRLLKL